MMDKQKIEGFAGRESIPVGVLIELFFGGSAETLQELGRADRLYPHLAPKGRNKIILAYENFSKWVVALIHPNPGNRASLLDILKSPVNTQDIYSWLCKNQIDLSFSPQVELFIKTFQEIQSKKNQPIPDLPTHADRYQPSIVRRESRKKDTQEMYKSWKKAHREWKIKRPNMSDTWYSQQIEQMDIAQGRKSETIRKNMKK